MRRNFDLSTGLVAIGAVAVLVSLFLDWYAPGLSAWDAFELADWLLAALAAGALVVLFAETVGTAPPTRRLAWISGIVALVVVAQLLDPPPAASGAEREVGAWIALGGAVLMVTGVVLALMRISVTIDVAARERRRRTSAVDARGAADEDDGVGGQGRGTASTSESGGGAGAASAHGPSESVRGAAAGSAGGSGGAGERGATAPVEPGGLWKAPRASGAGTEDDAEPVDAEVAAEDPDRTQPLPRVERPDASE